MHFSIVAALFVSLAATASAVVIFAGSGNCDGADYSCINSPPELRSYTLQSNPLGLEPLATLNTAGGLPSWTKTAITDKGQKCLFTTITDTHYVLSFNIGDQNTLKSNVTTHGINPVFLDVNVASTVLAVANYHGPDTTTQDDSTSGIATFLIADDCSLKFVQYVPAFGRSVNPGRQGASHIHSVNFFESGSTLMLLACDLGADAIITYLVDRDTAILKFAAVTNSTHGYPANSTIPLGSGPRHMVRHPNYQMVYTVFEMGNLVIRFSVSSDGRLHQNGRYTTLGKGNTFSGYSKAAEILITDDGKQLLISNRGFGPDSGSVMVYSLDLNGEPRHSVLTQVGDSFPRGMLLLKSTPNPTLLVAGQSRSELMFFQVEETGKLTHSGSKVKGPPNPTTVSVMR